MAPKIVDREDKRRELARAAVDLFARDGIDRVTMEAIARAAGVSKGTIYHYFPSKEDLVDAAVLSLFADDFDALEVAQQGDDPLAAVRTVIWEVVASVRRLEEQYGFFLEYMLYVYRKGGGPRAFTDALRGLRRAVSDLLEQARRAGRLRPDVSIPEAAAALLAWVDGAVWHGMMLPEPDLAAMTDAFLDAMMRGMEVSP